MVWLCLREIWVRVEVIGLHTGSANAVDTMPLGILNNGKGPRSSYCFFVIDFVINYSPDWT